MLTPRLLAVAAALAAFVHASAAAAAAWPPSGPSCSLPQGTKYTAVHYLKKTVQSPDQRCSALPPGISVPCQVDLQGVLYEPKGSGNKPVLIWNHGSERVQPWQATNDYCGIARTFVKLGFIVFVPFRRGHGPSTGQYVGDIFENGTIVDQASVVPLLQGQTDDVKAALQYVKNSVADAKKTEIVVAGLSYGGMVSLLSAIYVSGFQAALDISGGALSWNGNAMLRSQLKSLTPGVKIPTFMFQDDKECAGANPTQTLGPLLPKGSKYKVYTGFPQMECHDAHGQFVYTETGQKLWLDDALAFLKNKGIAP
jgi:dienelactone hydrolase